MLPFYYIHIGLNKCISILLAENFLHVIYLFYQLSALIAIITSVNKFDGSCS